MKISKKLFFIPLLTIFALPSVFSQAFFSGETGISTDFKNQKARHFDPSLNLNGFFSGQFDFGRNFLVRGEFSVQTQDLYNDFFAETPSLFRVDELSCTYLKPYYGATHFLSFFLGTYEPVGTGTFLKHILGVEPYSSRLTETYLGLNGCNVYDFYGYGGAYTFRLDALPVASGILIYKNNKNEDEDAQLNADLRIGTAFKYLTMEIAAGLGAPMNTQNDEGEDVVLLIETIYLHTGLDLLLGNRNSLFSIFTQAGFENLPIHSKNKAQKIAAKDFYFIVEPRLNIDGIIVTTSMFNLPQEKVKKTMLLQDTLGFDLSLSTSRFSTVTRAMEFGFHATVSFEGKDLKDFDDDDFRESVNFNFSPFLKAEVMKGELNTVLLVNATKFADSKPESVRLLLGYKKSL